MEKKTAIVGAGLIGRAWAITFARGGDRVVLFDTADGAAEQAVRTIAGLLADLERQDLLHGQTGAEVLGRIRAAATLAEALDGAGHVQECILENVELKRTLFAELDQVAAADAVLASSTSALLPSAFTDGLDGRHRCLVAHPINPPYLIPAVEVVPAPWTDPAVVEAAAVRLRAIGQEPIVMKKEIDGFIMNRLQGALLHEAFRLVADGYATPADVDAGICQGIGLRWAFMGPFETIDLNAPGGVRDYVERYKGLYVNLGNQQMRMVDWAGDVLDRVEAARAAALPRDRLAERQQWRDWRLMALAAHKAAADEKLGK